MLTRIQSREIDRRAIEELGIPSIVLMENAGRGCADVLLQEMQQPRHVEDNRLTNRRESANASETSQPSCHVKRSVGICCGPGNNGGDGFVIARHLVLAGMTTRVFLLSDRHRYRGDALVNLQILERMQIPTQVLSDTGDWKALMTLFEPEGHPVFDWFVDALLGTGSQGRLEGRIRTCVEAMNQAKSKRLAVDLPTGVDCDTGAVLDLAFHADITCTFVDQKSGFSNPEARPYLGSIKVIGIGAPLSL